MNFFKDNPDLQFIFQTAELDDIIRLFEGDFREHRECDYAPESAADALDHYRRALEVTGDIAGRIIAPLAERIDREPHTIRQGTVELCEPVRESIQALCRAELMGCTISRKYGGLNLPNFIFTMLVEMVSQADASIQNIFGLQGISSIIEEFAEEELKEKYLPLFADGAVTGAMALTEDEAGSDLQKVKMRAEQAPDGTWRLSGVKRFITNGGAEVLLVLARSEPGTDDGLGLSLFLCDKGPTISVRRLEDKLGIHGSPTCELAFQDTPARLVGERQRGLVTYVLALLNGARLATAAQAIGIAQAAMNEARPYARARKQYGRRIEALPPVAEMLANIQVEIEGARALNYETAKVLDRSIGIGRRMAGGEVPPEEKKLLRKQAKRLERLGLLLTSLTKYYCTEMSLRATRDAMQVLGGSGYMRDYPVERYYRDARITTIYEGTSQLQVLSAFRGILSGTMEKYYDDLEKSDFSGPRAALLKKLQKGRQVLNKSLERLTGKKDNQLTDLCSRTIVDMAADILIGYLLLKQSIHSPRKLKIAGMFIRKAGAAQKMQAERIKQADKGCLKHYALIFNS